MFVAGRLTVAVALAIATAACESTPVCPVTVAEAEAGAFSAIGDETYVAVGHVIRYVPSPELDARGYDISVDRTFHGETSIEGTFLQVEREVPNIRPGQAVIVVAERGSNERVIVQGICVPLVPIGEAEQEP